jgi:hypothetical protein
VYGRERPVLEADAYVWFWCGERIGIGVGGAPGRVGEGIAVRWVALREPIEGRVRYDIGA